MDTKLKSTEKKSEWVRCSWIEGASNFLFCHYFYAFQRVTFDIPFDVNEVIYLSYHTLDTLLSYHESRLRMKHLRRRL